MTVVADASPLITLTKIGRLDLLPQLYETVTITPEVHSEVVIAGSDQAGASEISTARWIDVSHLREPIGLAAQRSYGLGAGELSTISLGWELHADLLLIDDLKARKLARSKGLPVLGCIGILHDAFSRKLLPDLPAAYRQLLASGAYVDRGLLEHILNLLGLPAL